MSAETLRAWRAANPGRAQEQQRERRRASPTKSGRHRPGDGETMSQAEVAAALGISHNRVSQIEIALLAKLRKALDDPERPDARPLWQRAIEARARQPRRVGGRFARRHEGGRGQ